MAAAHKIIRFRNHRLGGGTDLQAKLIAHGLGWFLFEETDASASEGK
jgi:hypothetical protein